MIAELAIVITLQSSEPKKEIINYIEEICSEYAGIEPEIVEALIERESSFNPDAESEAGAIGLMQIIPKWHEERMNRLGVNDLKDPCSNILTGIDYLDELLRSSDSIEEALMIYNAGYKGRELYQQGFISKYAHEIVTRSYEIKKEKMQMTDIIISQQGAVSCDFEGIKKHLEEQLSVYSNLVFTEDTKKDAKNTVAELRREKKAFSDRVKEIKAEYMKPFDEFYAQACEIEALYDKPIIAINDQIDEFEKKRIEEKKIITRSIYAELVPEIDLQIIIPYERIYNPKWDNATFGEKQIKEEIMERKIKAKEAIEAIKSLGSEKEAEAIEMYKRSFNLSECLIYLNNYEKQKAEIIKQEQEAIRRAEEDRIRAEEREKIKAEEMQAKALQQAQEEARREVIDNLIPEASESEETEEITYMIKLTRSERESLEMFMNSVGIEFEILP